MLFVGAQGLQSRISNEAKEGLDFVSSGHDSEERDFTGAAFARMVYKYAISRSDVQDGVSSTKLGYPSRTMSGEQFYVFKVFSRSATITLAYQCDGLDILG